MLLLTWKVYKKKLLFGLFTSVKTVRLVYTN